jgi:hypothetical protein
MNGKGDKRRPCFVPRKEFEENWERTFNKDIRRLQHEVRPRVDHETWENEGGALNETPKP